ncbi:uncharacterized protein LOC126301915 [Schistocerca gregaria]|uniref:uncharacterized protein LOC126301915 n=1 Tax=Schistocerca gregaria TaxID=7010 RepID=UPI00211EA8EB|nr:uncharacterized protein LOC126301915 [Schistocerca gregaria]
MRGPEFLFGALFGALVALCMHFSRQRQLTYENQPTNSGSSGPGYSWTHPQAEQKGRRNSIDECIICLQAVDANSTTSRKLRCGHIFHYKCLVSWLKEKKECPLCRKPATQ